MKTITNEIVKRFELHLYEEEKSDNTIEKYIRDIRFFREWLNGKDVDKSAVLEYKKELCEKYAPKSVNSVLSSINALFSFMEWHELKVKMLKIQRQIFADKEKELTKSEYERLLTAAQKRKDKRLYFLMQTIGSTGIRISELRFVTCEAINAGKAVINCKGKLRQVFFPKNLCKMLKGFIKSEKIKSGPVFVTKSGIPLDRSNVWKMMKSICVDAQVSKDKVFPHNFRHLFARTFYSIQKDIVRLADILGHSSINTTRIYTIEAV
ncbi:MAG: tyrosine-type recombinase/integrase [Clostridia bacterium]|nr:tyrosine-type recombinase/integrase [Clostridia bacterium]